MDMYDVLVRKILGGKQQDWERFFNLSNKWGISIDDILKRVRELTNCDLSFSDFMYVTKKAEELEKVFKEKVKNLKLKEV